MLGVDGAHLFQIQKLADHFDVSLLTCGDNTKTKALQQRHKNKSIAVTTHGQKHCGDDTRTKALQRRHKDKASARDP
jgi:hypothetical protein